MQGRAHHQLAPSIGECSAEKCVECDLRLLAFFSCRYSLAGAAAGGGAIRVGLKAVLLR
jgi:hypothetical protein